MTIEALGIVVDSSQAARATGVLDRMTASARRAEGGVDRLGRESKRASGGVNQLAGSTDKLAKTLVRGFYILTTGLLTRALVNAADGWTRLQNQVGAATRDMAGAADTMERMVEISRASFSSLDQTVQAYSSAAVTFRGMGRSAAEAADYVEALNLHLVAGYVEGQQAASVTLALSRAMAVGTLRAQGLETVLGNSMEVAEALANELGITVNELRTFASEGKITGDVIANALTGNLEEMRDVVANMPWSIQGALSAFRLEFQVAASAINEGTGATEALAQGIRKLADALKTVGSWDWTRIAERGMRAVTIAATALAGVLAGRLLASLAGTLATALAVGPALWTQYYATVALTGATTLLSRALTLLGGPWGLLLAGAGALVAYFWDFGAATKETTHEMLAARDASGQMVGALQRIEQGARLATEEMHGLTKAILEAREAELSAEMGRAMVGVARTLRDFAGEAEVIIAPPVGIDMSDADREMMALQDTIRGRLGSIYDDFIGLRLSAEDAISELDSLLDSPFRATFDEAHGEGAFLARIAQAQQMITLADEARGAWHNVWQAVREFGDEAVETAERLAQAQITANEELAEMIAGYERRAEVARLEAQYGRESIQVMADRLAHARATVAEQVALSDATEDTKRRTMEAYDAMIRAENAGEAWGLAVKGVRDWADRARTALEQMAQSEPGAGWLDTAIAKAATLAGTLWDAAAGMLAASGTTPGFAGPRPQARPNDIDFGVPPITHGGGGGAQVDEFADAMARLNEEFERNNVLLTQGELAADIWQAQRDAGVEALSAQGQQIDATIRQIALQEEQLSLLDRARAKADEWKNTIQDAFVSFVTGANSFKESLISIIAKLAEMMAMKAFEVLWGGAGGFGGFGGGLTSLIGGLFGFAASGTSFASGGPTWVGERGPELLDLPPGARVYNAQQSRDMARQGGAGGVVKIIIEEAPGFASKVSTVAQGVAVQVVSAAGRRQADQKYLTGGA